MILVIIHPLLCNLLQMRLLKMTILMDVPVIPNNPNITMITDWTMLLESQMVLDWPLFTCSNTVIKVNTYKEDKHPIMLE